MEQYTHIIIKYLGTKGLFTLSEVNRFMNQMTIKARMYHYGRFFGYNKLVKEEKWGHLNLLVKNKYKQNTYKDIYNDVKIITDENYIGLYNIDNDLPDLLYEFTNVKYIYTPVHNKGVEIVFVTNNKEYYFIQMRSCLCKIHIIKFTPKDNEEILHVVQYPTHEDARVTIGVGEKYLYYFIDMDDDKINYMDKNYVLGKITNIPDTWYNKKMYIKKLFDIYVKHVENPSKHKYIKRLD